MTTRRPPPFRAEHVGSLLRPPELRQAFRAVSEGKLDAAGFRAVQDRAIREVVALQERIGLEGVTDGEFRRASYWSHFVDGVEGLAVAQARFDFHDDDHAATHFLAPLPTGRLRRKGSISGAEYNFVASITRRTPKLTMPAPSTMHFWCESDSVRTAGYGDDDAYFADLARVFREEIADLGQRGATYIQLDEVALAMLCDEQIRARVRARGEDPDRLIGDYVALVNACLAGRPGGMSVCMHLCRGNFKGKWLAEGSYRYIAERLFNEIEVDGFFLEYDTERAGDFTPLASVPQDKTIVLGLVSSKSPRLEQPGDLRRRIEEAAKLVPLDRLALSPQCGFASAVSGNPVSLDDEIAKLQLVVQVARQVWP
ncbi:MAG: 5-methyltetrahydropteroyltriglutamate--homocysteine S-methyltransferase [Stellaceae bacterium]